MKFHHFANALTVLAVAFLIFAGGIVVSLYQVWPYPIFQDANQALQAELEKSAAGVSPFVTDLWRPARFSARGVTVYKPNQMQPGYTLYTSGDANVARLIDAQGHVLHTWRMPFSKVWDKHAAVAHPQPNDLIYMRRAKLLPNGNLIAIYICADDTPWGYGMVELTPQSKVVWKYLEPVNHDFSITPDGRIVTLVQHFSHQPIPNFSFVPTPYLEDYLVTLSPQGKPLRKLSITQMLVHSPYSVALLRGLPWFDNFDPLHPNTVDYLDAAKAKAFGFGRAGDVLVMLRNINLLVLIDPREKRIVWAMHGNWLNPHDPHVLANGNVLIFDNLGNMAYGNPSRVYEFNPHNDKIVWSYTGPKNAPLYSPIRSTDQRLANGNTLITESDGGRILEVTPDKKVVWEYINPIRGGQDNRMIPVISGGYRIDPAKLDPAFRNELAAAQKKALAHNAPSGSGPDKALPR